MTGFCRRLLSVFGPLVLWALLAVGSGNWAAAQEQTSPEGSGSGDTAAVLDPLLDVLQNDDARNRLVQALEAAVAEDTGVTVQAGAEEPARASSIGTRIAEVTQDAALGLVARLDDVLQSVLSGRTLLDGLSGNELSVLMAALQNLALVIVVTVAVYLGLRAVMIPFFGRMGDRATQANILRKGLLFTGSIVLDVGIVIAAWGLGYAITLLFLGDFGQIDFRQVLYLNAFLMVELIKAGLRAILSPSAGGLRPINLSNEAARRLNRHSNVVVSVLGYGQLLAVPIVNRNLSFAAGLAISALLSVFVLLYLTMLVLRHRTAVADWLARRLGSNRFEDEDSNTRPPRVQLPGMLGTLVRSWHWFTLAYLAFMFLSVMSQPAEVVGAYVLASGKVLLAVLLGSMIVGGLGRSLRRGIRLPDELRARLPLLETRLNAIVPKLLIGLRVLVGVAVAAYALDVIGISDVGGWLRSELGLSFSGRAVSVVLILLVAVLIWLAFNSWIDFRLNPDYGAVPTARETTLLTLLRNAAMIALLVITLMITLSEIGINIGPLLASAGVLGLAIGFGAQKMVQDIITGVFIQFENSMNVGDVVTVGSTTGVVEKLTVRSVSLRDLDGTFHIVPFSSVDMVSNYMRDFSYFRCDMGVAYRENIDEVKLAMFDAFDELKNDPDQAHHLLDDELEWFGLNDFGDSAVVLRARIKTTPGTQWGVGRAYRAQLKRIFDERGIEIPFPHQTIYFGEGKDGRTQTLRLAETTRDFPSQSDTTAES